MIDNLDTPVTQTPAIAPEGADPRQQGRSLEPIDPGSTADEVKASALQPATGARHTFDMEGLVGYILLVGVLTSVSLIVGGLAWHFARTGEIGIQYNIAGMNFFEFLRDGLRQVFADQYRPRLLVSLGIAMLMLTPFVRVLASMIYFLVAARNWKYAAFTGFVLTVLTYSLFLR